jgi:hypothetical protein
MSKKKKKKKKNKFQGYRYEQKKEIQKRIAVAREKLRLLHNCVTHSDINTDRIYNELFEVVEALYVDLDIGALAQDNQRRWREEKERVRKAHG